MEELYFMAYCETVKIPLYIAKRIINARYKPYLSVLDDKYYGGCLGLPKDPWVAKVNALTIAITKWGTEEVARKLRNLKRG